MKYKFKPLMLGGAIAVTTALSGCGSDQSQPEITDVFEEVGLWCKSPDIVQIASADFYPLSADEETALETGKAAAKAQALADAGGTWTTEEEAEWEESFKYEDLDLYDILGLTLEEKERQVIAKEEARAFQIERGQADIRGDDFEAWFDDWFDAIHPQTYLGPSQRLNRAVNATTPAMDGEEICYTPPLSCPNYKVIDETGTYECIVPEVNPIVGAPAPVVTAGANEAVAFYRHEDHVEGGDNSALYENMVVHTWNDDAGTCVSYQDDSISSWGSNSTYSNDNNGIDPNYGKYWKLHILDAPSNCANIIFNDTADGKKISDNDLMMPIGPSGNVVLHNLDKSAYAHDDFPANSLDGMLLINQHPFFGAEASSGLASCGWSLEADESGEQCIGEALVCPEGSVAVGVGAVDVASKCVTVFDPETTDLLLKGAFNGWGSADDVNFEASQLEYVGDGQYRVNYLYNSECEVVEAVEATETTEAVEGEDCIDSFDFKVADLDWSEPASFGSIKGGDQSAVGSTITMTVGSGVGQNMKVDMEKDKLYQFLVNASNPEAVELTINEVPVNAFPMLTIGTQTVALDYSSDGNYDVRLTLEAGSHSFTIADESTGFSVGAVGTDNVVTESTPLALEDDGGALSFTSDAAEYDFVLNMSDPAAPTIEIKPALPWGSTPVFIRGSLNGWSSPTADEMQWDAATRTYSVIYGLEADGTHEFKFADASWGVVNLGTGDVTLSDEGETLSGDGNIQLTVDKSTTYIFEVSFETADPVVKVSEAPLYLRGSVTTTGWGADEGNQFMFAPTDEANTAEASHVYSIEVNYAGGSNEFKVADEGWGGTFGYDFGAADAGNVDIVLGVAMPLTKSGANLKINEIAGTYIFTFDDANKTMTVTAK